jgi:hypothetical protein
VKAVSTAAAAAVAVYQFTNHCSLELVAASSSGYKSRRTSWNAPVRVRDGTLNFTVRVWQESIGPGLVVQPISFRVN